MRSTGRFPWAPTSRGPVSGLEAAIAECREDNLGLEPQARIVDRRGLPGYISACVKSTTGGRSSSRSTVEVNRVRSQELPPVQQLRRTDRIEEPL